MNKRVYDCSMLAGIILTTAGAGVAFGLAAALATAGVLVIGLTILAASIGR